MRTVFVSAVLSCAVLTFAGGARAQDRTYVERRDADGQDIRFDDDPLDAVDRESLGTQITHWITARRFLLARPRQTFVPEMLRNVEGL
jgi:hypothetical protein